MQAQLAGSENGDVTNWATGAMPLSNIQNTVNTMAKREQKSKKRKYDEISTQENVINHATDEENQDLQDVSSDESTDIYIGTTFTRNGKRLHIDPDGWAGYRPAFPPKCSGKPSCNVKLHQTEGILCKNHVHNFANYQPEILFALMLRLTKDATGLHRTCILCPGQLFRESQILIHVQGHGSELGPIPKTAHDLKWQLKSVETNGFSMDNVCDICLANVSTNYGLYLHRIQEHKEDINSP